MAYWASQLRDLNALELPADRLRARAVSRRAARHRLMIPGELTASLRNLGRREGATLFMTLLAAFQALLSRYTGSQDVAVRSPVAGRSRQETEGLIGLFINTLVLRADLTGDLSFVEHLRKVREASLQAFARQEMPFGKLVEHLAPARSPGRTPFSPFLFMLQNSPRPPLELAGLTVKPRETSTSTTGFDLTLEVWLRDGGLDCCFEYRSDLFEPSTIERMAGHFRMLLGAIVADPDTRVSELTLMDAEEGRRLLVEWSGAHADVPRECVHRLFEAQAEKTPRAIAVEMEGKALTYRELNLRANRLARRLAAGGVGPEVLVGLFVERSPAIIVGLLGILKAGGAYLPLDPAEIPDGGLGRRDRIDRETPGLAIAARGRPRPAR